jgi:scyllo-inositol 2-dehydrogenase (NADP+)
MAQQHKPIAVGIIGLGRSGWAIHARAIRELPDTYRLVAVHDPIATRMQEAVHDFECRVHASPEDLMRDPAVELVVVASPNAKHAPMAIAALQAGKHVLCEKPFGLVTADVDAMIAASTRAGRVLQPFQQRRFEPDFRKVMEIAGSGLLGEIQLVRICWHGFKRRWDWQTLKSYSGGALNNNGPHPIDHAMALFGEGDPEVWCEMRRCLSSGDAEDYLKIILKGKGHPTVEVELMDCVAYGQDRWLVCGTAGGLKGDANHLEWKWVDWSTMPPRPVTDQPTPDRSYNSEKLEFKTGTWSAPAAADTGSGATPSAQPVLDMYADLHAAIREGRPQSITPQSVRRRVAVMEKARKSQA